MPLVLGGPSAGTLGFGMVSELPCLQRFSGLRLTLVLAVHGVGESSRHRFEAGALGASFNFTWAWEGLGA